MSDALRNRVTPRRTYPRHNNQCDFKIIYSRMRQLMGSTRCQTTREDMVRNRQRSLRPGKEKTTQPRPSAHPASSAFAARSSSPDGADAAAPFVTSA